MKVGGPAMTVAAVGDATVTVVWFDLVGSQGDEEWRGPFERSILADALEVLPEPKRAAPPLQVVP